MCLTLYLYQFEMQVVIIICILSPLSFLEGWISPSRNSLLPRLVERENLARANSFVATTDQMALFIGFALGGMAVVHYGVVNTLLVTVSFLLLSISSLFVINADSAINQVCTEPGGVSWKTITNSWFYVYTHPIYRRLFAMDALEFFAASVWSGAFLLVFVKEVLHQSESWWGFLNGAYLLGCSLGGVVAAVISTFVLGHLKKIFILSSLGMAIMTIAFSYPPSAMIVMVYAFVQGIPYQIRDVAQRTLMQINADNDQLPQVFALHQTLFTVCFTLGLIVMGIIAEVSGVRTIFPLSAGLVLLSAWLARQLPVDK